jgi:glycosyltransferase involved in cell wall biosynthesis
MTRKVYLEPIWKFHAFGKQLSAFPPTGYEFIAAKTSREKLFDTISHFDIGRFLLRSVDLVLPTRLVKSWLEKFDTPPANSKLTYACDHLVFRPEPWVVEVEYASLVVGIDPKHLKRYKMTIERMLASPYCKRILCWAEAGRRSLLHDVDCSEFHDKIELVHYAIPRRSFVKKYGNDTVRFLFVGSGTSKGGFDYRGGREVMATFALLRQRYDNLELVVRSDVPPDVKARYKGMEGLKLIENMISQEELEREFFSADIFIIPSHNTSPMIMLDAMSCELPVITIDAWANPEMIEDGKTGLVARSSRRLPYYYGDTLQPNWAATEFKKAILTPDPNVVDDLVAKGSLLIENPELRRNLGKAARGEIENGKFSLKKMNEKLGRIFDEAIDGESTRDRKPI